jgi:arylsulfatase A-like enzyme
MNYCEFKWKKRLQTLWVVIIVSVISGACASSNNSAQSVSHTKRPNILLILTDDQKRSSVGNPTIQTPNINALAEQGVTISHVFNQGSWSGAVCRPSRNMINTGRHLYHTGRDPRGLSASGTVKVPVMWGEAFRQAGYKTFMTGKWHLTEDEFMRSFDDGDAIFMGGMSASHKGGHWRTAFHHYDPAGKFDKQTLYEARQHSTQEIADAAVDYLKTKTGKSDNPFFMYVATMAPHDPVESPKIYEDRYKPEDIKLPPNFLPEHPFDQGDHNNRDERLLPFPRTQEKTREAIAKYHAMVEHLDAQIGRILQALEASGEADNTIVIFTSDHGLAIGEHGLMGKQNVYDHSVRSPFIIKGPGIEQGKTRTGRFHLNSLFATTAELAGVEIPDTVEAPSAVPVITGEKDTLHNTIYTGYKHYSQMVQDDRHKLIRYPVLRKLQLFDLQQDPWEIQNLADDPAYADTIQELTNHMELWRARIGDPIDLQRPVASFQEQLGKGVKEASKKNKGK